MNKKSSEVDELSSYTGPSTPSSMGFMSGNEEEEVEGEELVKEYLHLLVSDDQLINEIIRKCGDKWCLYSKHKKGGKRRRLGTHPSKAAAYRQERAIKAHGG